MSSVSYAVMDTPLDRLGVAWSTAGLRCIWFAGADPDAPAPAEWQPRPEPAFGAGEQLAAYFSGERVDFDLPLDARGTPFQRRVWQALTEIPYGSTSTYGEIARRLGRPRRRAPWAEPTTAIRCPWSSPATASSAPAGP